MAYDDTLAKRIAIQKALIAKGYDVGPDGADGDLGQNTAKALIALRVANGWPPVATIDTNVMRALGLLAIQETTSMIPASFTDYIVNFLSSKINWFAGVMAIAIVTFVNNHFGLNLDAGTTAAITTLLVSALTAGVWVLRTFFNSPKVVAGAVVK